jgi:hypothetical protein
MTQQQQQPHVAILTTCLPCVVTVTMSLPVPQTYPPDTTTAGTTLLLLCQLLPHLPVCPDPTSHLVAAAVLSRVSTALPDESGLLGGISGGSFSYRGGDGGSRNSPAAWYGYGGSGSSFGADAASRSGSSSAGDAVMAPVLLLAEAVGRAVNARVR